MATRPARTAAVGIVLIGRSGLVVAWPLAAVDVARPAVTGPAITSNDKIQMCALETVRHRRQMETGAVTASVMPWNGAR